MRKEYICKWCGGHATKEYYQENPDCKQCPEYEGCSGAINGHCLISSKESCPSCQDGHIPLSEMIMMVNEALCDANRAFRKGFRWGEGRSVAHIIEKLKPEEREGYYKYWCSYRAEHFLALSVVRLREISEVYDFGLDPMPEHMTSEILKGDTASILRDVCSSVLKTRVGKSHSGICYLAKHLNIPLEKHIDALIAYEKGSE